ncbi:phosphatidate cytidylyltransferase [Pararhizobium mangrovi]|uniref:Phosphatidate cytidylyltransferase n=1 Tax=Pararhizobium mangrovi TaxID=2590452 RepID=A0A506UGK8_9HYPH|nr:phosphatidate cytidylyltransferase [Pararhizobium mangrovi]TPW31217.1 phosphatidate cytidylyltransferase [Pararhizobium mangrovi]
MSGDLGRRAASALVMGVVVLVATWFGGLAFRILMAVAAVLVFHEWAGIVGARVLHEKVAIFAGLAVVLCALAIVFHHGEIAMALAVIAAVCVAAWQRLARRRLWLAGGIVYAVVPAVALAVLRGDGGQGLVAILGLFAVVWTSDIAAYFVGRRVGGRKLAPRISPGKTWSGAVGGTLAGIVVGTAVFSIGEGGGPIVWLGLVCLALSVCGQAGDLFESWIKRRFGVKDSSRLIPGHGGLMDRIDALVFAAFAAYLVTVLVPGLIKPAQAGTMTSRAVSSRGAALCADARPSRRALRVAQGGGSWTS